MTTISLPADPLARFCELFSALNEGRTWTQGADSLRYAALIALSCEGSARDVARRIRRIADQMKRDVGAFHQLRGDLRFAIAAQFVQQGGGARGLAAEFQRIHKLFRDQGVRRGSIYEVGAVAILHSMARARDKRVGATEIRRFQSIYEQMKKHHWWLTGPDDFPMCAILAGTTDTVEAIGNRSERIYQALVREGFTKGDPLQMAAHLLYLAAGQPSAVAHRFRGLADGFRQSGVRVWQSDYDELAVLAFLDHRPDEVVQRVLAHRETIRALRPRPNYLLTYSLASHTAFAELVAEDLSGNATALGARSMAAMQSILLAQQTASLVAATNSSAAAAAAAAS